MTSLQKILTNILGVDFRYPVGSYYETDNANFDPNTAWGGTWVKEAEGKVHVSAGSTYTAGTEYGSNTHTHPTGDFTLQLNHIPAHSHTAATSLVAYSEQGVSTMGYAYGGNPFSGIASGRTLVNNAGGGQAHNHGSTGSTTRDSWQPSIAIYRWHRIG